jgi:DNA-binding NtrC family response regulator
MPRMNGIEMVKKIRSLNPKIKVIFVSGFFGIKELKRELNEELLNHGYRTLSKPFKISGMLDLVNEYLSAARTVNFVKGI